MAEKQQQLAKELFATKLRLEELGAVLTANKSAIEQFKQLRNHLYKRNKDLETRTKRDRLRLEEAKLVTTEQKKQISDLKNIIAEDQNKVLALEEETVRLQTLVDDLTVQANKERELREEAENIREKLYEELEELTAQLFQAANDMVEGECKEKHKILKIKKQLESELQQTKHRLSIEESVLGDLRKRISAQIFQEPHTIQLVSNGSVGRRSKTFEGAACSFEKRSTAGSILNPSFFNKDATEDNNNVEKKTKREAKSTSPKPKIKENNPHIRITVEPSSKQLEEWDDYIKSGCPILKSSKLLSRIEKEEVIPTVRFRRANDVLRHIKHRTLEIELAPENDRATTCSTCLQQMECRFMLLRGKRNNPSVPICLHCRTRIVAVCDFYAFLRTIEQGHLNKKSNAALFESFQLYRLKMATCRISTN